MKQRNVRVLSNRRWGARTSEYKDKTLDKSDR